MNLLAAIELSPGGIFSWIFVGLISGWLAGKVMSGAGYGIVRDILLGLVGAFVGGFVSGFFIHGVAHFWGSVLVAFVGSCLLIALARMVSPHRSLPQ